MPARRSVRASGQRGAPGAGPCTVSAPGTEDSVSLLEIVAQQTVNGLTIGSFHALIALGYTMVYGIIRLINFPHGDIFSLGAFLTLSLAQGLAWATATGAGVGATLLLGTVAASVAVGFLGVSIERYAYRPLRAGSRLIPLISRSASPS